MNKQFLTVSAFILSATIIPTVASAQVVVEYPQPGNYHPPVFSPDVYAHDLRHGIITGEPVLNNGYDELYGVNLDGEQRLVKKQVSTNDAQFDFQTWIVQQKFIGKVWSDDLALQIHYTRPASLKGFYIRTLRPNEVITMEYNAHRINFNINEKGVIYKAYIG